jgi:Zn finger protein HypA/HybF involved in hydrogenase expression
MKGVNEMTNLIAYVCNDCGNEFELESGDTVECPSCGSEDVEISDEDAEG